MTAIRLYVGINETVWNEQRPEPGSYACVAPVYGKTESTKKTNSVYIPDGTLVLQDSGAFSDGPGQRISFKDAYDRQVAHAIRYSYDDKIESVASYDLLIDEKWHDGIRSKLRWSEAEAWDAVDETVAAARYISRRKEWPVVYSAQGVSLQQYRKCVMDVSQFFEDDDILGLGGWCIIGIRKSLIEPFKQIVSEVVPLASNFTNRIHIWGVMYAPALGFLLSVCDDYGIELSTDSSGPSVRPARGMWGYMGWVDRDYERPAARVRGAERARHVVECREWLNNFRETKFYKGE